MTKKKTDNHFTADKVALRASMTGHLDEIRVLDAYGGHGVVWTAVERVSGKPVDRTPIDNRLDLTNPHLHGDNLKVMQGLDLNQFNVIDLDAYGIPAAHIKMVCEKGFKGTVFVTALQINRSDLPSEVMKDVGIPVGTPPKMISRHGWSYFKGWLAGLGVKEITHRTWHGDRKHYLGFELT